MKVNNFVVIESEYGKFIVNRHCSYQAESLIKTGRPHIQIEIDTLLTIVSLLDKNCVIVDAGANIGLITIPIAQTVQFRSGVVYAFEPQRMLFNALCGSVALNDINNLFVRNQALGEKVTTQQASMPDYGQPQDFGLFSLIDKNHTKPEQIEVVTIDSLDLPRLDLLKIDVEGMEIEVLKGSRHTIERFLPWCWIEYWKVNMDNIKAQFSGFNYRFFKMDDLNMLCAPTEKLSTSKLNIKATEI